MSFWPEKKVWLIIIIDKNDLSQAWELSIAWTTGILEGSMLL